MEPRKEDIVYSQKFKAGRRRTYFFDIRQTRGGDKYVSVTESKRRDDGNGYDRHKIFIYKEDLTRFRDHLIDLVDEIKTLMPDYDFDEFARRAEERERLYQEQLEQERLAPTPVVEAQQEQPTTEEVTVIKEEMPNITESTNVVDEKDGTIEEDDLSW